MTFASAASDLSSYRDAVAMHFGEQVLQRFDAACLTEASAIEDPDERAAQLLAIAMCEATPQQAHDCLGAMRLTSVELQLGTASVVMEPHEAHAHPLLSDWTQDSLPLALADAIRAGRLLTALGPGSPVFGWFHLYHGDGAHLFAASQLQFSTDQGEAVAKFHFGPQASLGFVRASVAMGTTVFLVGAHVRESGGLVCVSADSTEGDVSSDPEPVFRAGDMLSSLFGRGTLH